MPKHTPSFLRTGLAWFPRVILIFLSLIALGNLAGFEFWPLSRLVHLPAYWSGLALVLSLAFVFRKRWWMAAAGVILALAFSAQVGALWLDPVPRPSTQAPGASEVRVMTFNVFFNNKRYAEVLAALKSANPEVLYLTEITPQWRKGLEELTQSYPFRLGNNKNLLLSRLPFENTRTVAVNFDTAQSAILAAGAAMDALDEDLRPQWRGTEILAATVVKGDRRLRIVGIHPPTPGSAISGLVQRATALACRQDMMTSPRTDAQILMGDFNTTRFSPTFRFILDQTGMVDSAQGFGYIPTWGPRLLREPILPWIGVPIDHVLVSQNAKVLEREVGPALGSDHRWVMARVQW